MIRFWSGINPTCYVETLLDNINDKVLIVPLLTGKAVVKLYFDIPVRYSWTDYQGIHDPEHVFYTNFKSMEEYNKYIESYKFDSKVESLLND